MASPQVWNARNPAVKRIVQELKECQRDDNPDILAEALEVRFILDILDFPSLTDSHYFKF
jgi:hypothetical protein